MRSQSKYFQSRCTCVTNEFQGQIFRKQATHDFSDAEPDDDAWEEPELPDEDPVELELVLVLAVKLNCAD